MNNILEYSRAVAEEVCYAGFGEEYGLPSEFDKDAYDKAVVRIINTMPENTIAKFDKFIKRENFYHMAGGGFNKMAVEYAEKYHYTKLYREIKVKHLNDMNKRIFREAKKFADKVFP